MWELKEYVDPAGRSPFGRWFEGLNAQAAAKVTVSLARLEAENSSNTKGVGEGVHELRIDFGPGYRVYFGRDGEAIVILLGGGTKRRQAADIANAKQRWLEFKRRKRQES